MWRKRTAQWSKAVPKVITAYSYGIRVYKPLSHYPTLSTNLNPTYSAFDSWTLCRGPGTSQVLGTLELWGIHHQSPYGEKSKHHKERALWGHTQGTLIQISRSKEGLWEENKLLNHRWIGVSCWRRQNQLGPMARKWESTGVPGTSGNEICTGD